METLKEYVPLIIFAGIAVVVVKFVLSARTPTPVKLQQMRSEQSTKQSGEAAPPDTNYNYVNKIRYQKAGMPQLVELFGTQCRPCQEQVPHIAQLAQKHPNVFVMSCTNASEAEIQDFITKFPDAKKINVARDAGGQVSGLAKRLGVNGVPHAFVFDKNGKMVWHGHPSQADAYVRAVDKETDAWATSGKGRTL